MEQHLFMNCQILRLGPQLLQVLIVLNSQRVPVEKEERNFQNEHFQLIRVEGGNSTGRRHSLVVEKLAPTGM